MEATSIKLRPAAQYLRMSTDHQRYSLDHQSAAISAYAREAGFEIVQTYTDAGRSGVTAKKRAGLSSLLSDVLSQKAPFVALLVLDVSRWGRYQDPDEAGHYEFLCRSAGVDVVYCAEKFEPGMAGTVFKQLKRVMAGEYSRELSAKVRASKQRFALVGNAMGGTCRYGFARQIVNPDGSLGPVLARGQRKQRPDQALRMVPEGEAQSAVLRLIFELFLSRHTPPAGIAAELERRDLKWLEGKPWDGQRVAQVLRCELVTGRQPFGKTTCVLGQPRIKNPRDTWGSVQVFPPIVAPRTYARAQARLAALNGRRVKTSAELLADLRRIHQKHGRVTGQLIDEDPKAAGSATYFSRFGTLIRAYEMVDLGYAPRARGRRPDGTRLSRDEVLDALCRCYRNNGRISMSICDADRSLPSLGWLRWEFGSLGEAYDAAGLPHCHHGGPKRNRWNSHPPGAGGGDGPGDVRVGPNGGRYIVTASGRKRYGGRLELSRHEPR